METKNKPEEQEKYTFANVTVSNGYSSPEYGAVPTVTINGSNYPNVVLGSGLTYTAGSNISGPTWATTTASPWLGNGISTDSSNSGKIKLTGENADIEVNGESLMGLLKQISERLNLITLNEKMEKEWDQLHELGEQYRALEAKLKEQSEMWAKLKAMPPPTIE